MKRLSLFRQNEKIPPPLYQFPRPWTPSRTDIKNYDMIQMDCPWCHTTVWTYPRSEPVGLAKYYGNFRAQESGGCICLACGRGIFFWGLPWVYHAEFDDDGSSATYYTWEAQQTDRPSRQTGLMAGPRERQPETPLRTWARADPDAPTVYTKIADAATHPCSIGNHRATYYCRGWADVPGALVLWLCGRCHVGRGWGRYEDGPSGPFYPEPSRIQQDEWARTGRELMAKRDAESLAQAEIEIPGECNAHWETNRCTRPPGHSGPHGLAIDDLILAPWS